MVKFRRYYMGLGLALAAAVGLAGCDATTNPLTSAITFLDAPTTQQAISTLENAGGKFVCEVATAQQFATLIEQGLGATIVGQSIIGTGGLVYFASSTACKVYTAATAVTVHQVMTVRQLKAMPHEQQKMLVRKYLGS